MDNFSELTSGVLVINKTTLAKDLLKKDSDFKYLLNKNRPIYRPPEIKKHEDSVIINFENGTDIDLENDYIEKFRELKRKYKNNLKGKIYVRVTFNTIFTSTIDLDGTNDIEVY